MTSVTPDRDRRDRAWAGCTRYAQGHPVLSTSERLRHLADAVELEVAELLGKPAAVFMPSGTMAQQCALRVWTDRVSTPVVAVHGLSHLVRHEEDALQVLHGLRLEQLTSERRPLTAEDLAGATTPPGALGG